MKPFGFCLPLLTVAITEDEHLVTTFEDFPTLRQVVQRWRRVAQHFRQGIENFVVVVGFRNPENTPSSDEA